VPVRGLIDGAEPDLNIVLTGGEEIRVPQVGKIFVVGSVKKPGAYPVQDNGETTLLQVLALAEGLQGVHSNNAYIYRREVAGNRNELTVPLKQIMQRKADDLRLQANDILYIPEDQKKKIALSVLEKTLEVMANGGATALAYSAIR
jgi:protein involved in polysaccharide export with SLBB domain